MLQCYSSAFTPRQREQTPLVSVYVRKSFKVKLHLQEYSDSENERRRRVPTSNINRPNAVYIIEDRFCGSRRIHSSSWWSAVLSSQCVYYQHTLPHHTLSAHDTSLFPAGSGLHLVLEKSLFKFSDHRMWQLLLIKSNKTSFRLYIWISLCSQLWIWSTFEPTPMLSERETPETLLTWPI